LNSARMNTSSKLAAQDARIGVENKGDRIRLVWRDRIAHHWTPASTSAVSRLIMRIGEHLVATSTFLVVAVALLMTAVIGTADLLAGPEISLSPFYLFPVAFVTWRLGKTRGLLFCFISAAVWLVPDGAAGQMYSNPSIPYWNALVRLGFFMIVAYTLAELSTRLEYVRTDYLTGLANARGFHELAMKEFQRCDRMGKGITIAYLDIDNFKTINDGYGHAAGDAVLRLFGRTLQSAGRKTDIVARVGGDEFTILLTGTDGSTASATVNKISTQLRGEIARCKWPVTFTVGMATFQRVPESVEVAVETADSLMYAAKQRGKNRVNHGVFPVPAEVAPQ
jgi:diguanylate cyclase (GGDEF)-like protein